MRHDQFLSSIIRMTQRTKEHHTNMFWRSERSFKRATNWPASLGAFRCWYLSVKITLSSRGCEWEGFSCSCFYSSYLLDEACCTELTCAGGRDKESAFRQKHKGMPQKSSRNGFLLSVSDFTLSGGPSTSPLEWQPITPMQLCCLITGSTFNPGLYKFPWHHKHRLVLQQREEILSVINM